MLIFETREYRLLEHDLRTLFRLGKYDTIVSGTVKLHANGPREGQVVSVTVNVSRPVKGVYLKGGYSK